jgi:hypothetical protein
MIHMVECLSLNPSTTKKKKNEATASHLLSLYFPASLPCSLNLCHLYHVCMFQVDNSDFLSFQPNHTLVSVLVLANPLLCCFLFLKSWLAEVCPLEYSRRRAYEEVLWTLHFRSTCLPYLSTNSTVKAAHRFLDDAGRRLYWLPAPIEQGGNVRPVQLSSLKSDSCLVSQTRWLLLFFEGHWVHQLCLRRLFWVNVP